MNTVLPTRPTEIHTGETLMLQTYADNIIRIDPQSENINKNTQRSLGIMLKTMSAIRPSIR